MKQEGYELINGLLVYFFRICMFTPSCVTPGWFRRTETYAAKCSPLNTLQSEARLALIRGTITKNHQKRWERTHTHTHACYCSVRQQFMSEVQYLCSHHGEPFGPQAGTSSLRSLTDVNIVDVFSPAIF